MSKEKKIESSERNEKDNYPTPQPTAQAICERLKILHPHPYELMEPSAGSGAFVKEARKLWPDKKIRAIEIRKEEEENLQASGATEVYIDSFELWLPGHDLAPGQLFLGNPPFSIAETHVGIALQYLHEGDWVAFLLKMNFFGSHKRVKGIWTKGQLKHLIPVVPRPSFKTTEKASNDTNEYGVFIWEVGWWGPTTILPHIIWRESRD